MLANGQAGGVLVLASGRASRVNSFPPFDSHPLMPRSPFSPPHTCIMEYGGGSDPLPMPPSAMSLPITSQPALLQPMLQLLFLCCWCSLLFLLPALSACSLSVVDLLSGLMGQWGPIFL